MFYANVDTAATLNRVRARICRSENSSDPLRVNNVIASHACIGSGFMDEAVKICTAIELE